MARLLMTHPLLVLTMAFSSLRPSSCLGSDSFLIGKRVLVTGSSAGIGAGIAKRLASRGANVLIHYNSRKEGALATKLAIEDSGVGSCAGMIQCDFRSPSAIGKMWRYIDEVWDSGIDILVNNAGIVTKRAAEDDPHLLAWNECMQINLNAPLQLSIEAHRRMRDQSTGGSIVMISSIHGSGSAEWMSAYACSKAGLDRLTAGLALEWAPDKVRVVGVAPGIVPVERTAALLSQPETQQLWAPHLPVGRMGSVEDIAEAVEYSLSAGWITGSILTINGGLMARANMPNRPRPPKEIDSSPPPSCEVKFSA